MNMHATMLQSKPFPVWDENIFKRFSEFINRIVWVQMIFLKLLKNNQNKQIQENILANHYKGKPEWNRSVYIN